MVTLTGLTDYKDLNSDAPLADAMKAAGFGTWMGDYKVDLPGVEEYMKVKEFQFK